MCRRLIFAINRVLHAFCLRCEHWAASLEVGNLGVFSFGKVSRLHISSWSGQDCRVCSRSRNESALSWTENSIFAPWLFCNVVNNCWLDVLPRARNCFNRDLSLDEPLFTGGETDICGALCSFIVSSTLQKAQSSFLVVAARTKCLILFLLDCRIDKSFDGRTEILQTLRLSFDFKYTLLRIMPWTWYCIRIRIALNQVLHPAATSQIHLGRQLWMLILLYGRITAKLSWFVVSSIRHSFDTRDKNAWRLLSVLR